MDCAETDLQRTPFNSPTSGFTLLEMLVVLVIFGLLASVALPRLQQIAQSTEIANQRRDILGSIEGLGYLAYRTGKAIELDNASLSELMDSPITPLQLPSGWQLKVPQGVSYSPMGICSGGTIVILAPGGSKETYRLEPPLCRPTPVDEAWNKK